MAEVLRAVGILLVGIFIGVCSALLAQNISGPSSIQFSPAQPVIQAAMQVQQLFRTRPDSNSNTNSSTGVEVVIAKQDFWVDAMFQVGLCSTLSTGMAMAGCVTKTGWQTSTLVMIGLLNVSDRVQSSFFSVPRCYFQGHPLHCHSVSALRSKWNQTAQELLTRASAMLHPRNWSRTTLEPTNLRTVPQVYFNMESIKTNHLLEMLHDAEIEMTYQKCSQASSKGLQEQLVCGIHLRQFAHSSTIFLGCHADDYTEQCHVAGIYVVNQSGSTPCPSTQHERTPITLLLLQVWSPYLHYFGWFTLGAFPTAPERLKLLQYPVVPFDQKLDAIFWASSNCFPRNDRTIKAGKLRDALANSSLAFHSYGRCLRNMNETALPKGHTGHLGKISFSSQYKFCIVSDDAAMA